eukprot:TRINITY_DN3326_c0_g1_i1.p1 TRINITY_DN3326_c0_g1~~TRINITY_DN3326_c0_g1_i1.p1  ORF type:complete len:285 (+),score=83.71 TRINITY_DN3326_c0_g1_i1:27-857(+)
MADPFAEFNQVAEEQKVAATSDVLVHVEGPDGVGVPIDRERSTSRDFSDFSVGAFPPEHQALAEEHFAKRRKYDAKIHSKLAEIDETMERLYLVRYEANSDKHDQLRNTKNMLTKLNILNEEVSSLRQKQMKMLQDQLNLDDIGLSKRIRTASFRKQSGIEFSDPSTSDETDSLVAETSSGGFMRTRSTNTLKDKDAEGKWGALFRMFKEYRFQSDVASAQHISTTRYEDEQQMVSAEIDKLRIAIAQLNNRAELSKADQTLLKILQAKLRALNQL